MIRVNCETFEWGWIVIITHVKGLKETKISQFSYTKPGRVNSAAEAIGSAVQWSRDYLHDEPETLEHR